MNTYRVQFWNYGEKYRDNKLVGNRVGTLPLGNGPVEVEARDAWEAVAVALATLTKGSSYLPAEFMKGHLGIQYIEEGSPKVVYGVKPKE